MKRVKRVKLVAKTTTQSCHSRSPRPRIPPDHIFDVLICWWLWSGRSCCFCAPGTSRSDGEPIFYQEARRTDWTDKQIEIDRLRQEKARRVHSHAMDPLDDKIVKMASAEFSETGSGEILLQTFPVLVCAAWGGICIDLLSLILCEGLIFPVWISALY